MSETFGQLGNNMSNEGNNMSHEGDHNEPFKKTILSISKEKLPIFFSKFVVFLCLKRITNGPYKFLL